MQSLLNVGLTLITMASGHIVDVFGYRWLEMFFAGCTAVSIACIAAMWVMDAGGDGYLNMGVAEREAYEQQRRIRQEGEDKRE